MKIQIDGGLFTTSGYSSAGRRFAHALELAGADVKIRDIPIQGDIPINYNHEMMANRGFHKEADINLMWGVPNLRGFYMQQPKSKGAEIQHFFSWEMNRLPEIWKHQLEDVDRVLTPSRFSRRAIKVSRSDKRVDLLPHGYDPIDYHKKDFEEQDGVFRVLFHGTWIKRKAPLETIISVAMGLAGTNSEIMVKLNYDGDTLQKIRNAVMSELMKIPQTFGKFPKIVFYNGNATPDQLNDFYNIADLVILTSRGEAWGLPLMNAIATETPIITTNKGGQMDFVPKSYQYLVDAGEKVIADGDGMYSPQFGLQWYNPIFTQIQEHVRHAYDNRDQLPRLGRSLFKYIEDKTWQNVAENYLNLMDN